jgi:FkbM family methyltransferase
MASIRGWVARATGYPFENIAGHTTFRPAIRPSPVILDVGANRGAFTAAFRGRFGGEAIFVEANPALAADLEPTPKGRVLNYAVASTNGPTAFNIARNDEGSSLLSLPDSSPFDCTVDRTMTVEGRTLDAILTEVGEPSIDVLKMDIEGAELDILADLTESVARRVAQLTVEFHTDAVFGFGRSDRAADVFRHLRKLGFRSFDFSNGPIAQEDMLFVNTGLWDHRASLVAWQAVARARTGYRSLRKRLRGS